MVGRPRTRAKLEQQIPTSELREIVAGIPDAVSEGEAPRGPAARMFHDHRLRSASHTGPQTRQTTDAENASEVASLARLLRPGLRVVIERVKPHWCQGILDENYIVSSGRVHDLIEHIREEYGGAAYRLTVLEPGGGVAFETRVAVSAPPRYEGRAINREQWTGEGTSSPRAASPAPSNATPEMFSMLLGALEVFGKVRGDGGSERLIEAMRTFQADAREQNRELIQAVVTTRATEGKQGSLIHQLREVVEAQAVIREAGEVLAPPPAPRSADDGDGLQDELMKGAVKEAMSHFVGSFVRSKMEPKAPPMHAHARVPARAYARGNSQNLPENSQIPDAEISGQ